MTNIQTQISQLVNFRKLIPLNSLKFMVLTVIPKSFDARFLPALGTAAFGK